MVTLQDLLAELNQTLRPDDYEDFCVNGLQFEASGKIRKAATAVTASLAAIEQAKAAGAETLVVHHGLFWKGDCPAITGTLSKKIQLLAKSGISLLAYHLPLDTHQELGNNWRAARDLGWTDLMPFCEIGVMGKPPETTREAFQKTIRDYYGQKGQAALGGKEKVCLAALVSGGAYKMIPQAARAGADVFITGNFDEPAWHMAHEEEINFFAMGHSATERIGPKALSAYIESRMGIAAPFLLDNNPF